MDSAVRGIRIVESREGKGEPRTSFDYRENNCNRELVVISAENMMWVSEA